MALKSKWYAYQGKHEDNVLSPLANIKIHDFAFFFIRKNLKHKYNVMAVLNSFKRQIACVWLINKFFNSINVQF